MLMYCYVYWILGLVHMRSQVPSPTHVGKSQHGGKVPAFEPQETIKIWLILIRSRISIILCKIFAGLVFNFGSSKKRDPTCNTNPKSHLQKVLSCRHPCHTWDLGLETPCEVVSV